MIEFVCTKKKSEETADGTKYEVWFQENGRVHAERVPGKMGPITEWQRYEVDAEQYAALRVGATYKLTLVVFG